METLEKKTQNVNWKEWIPGVGLIFCYRDVSKGRSNMSQRDRETLGYDVYQLLSTAVIGLSPLIYMQF